MRITYDASTNVLILFLSERPVVNSFGTAENAVEVDSDQAPVTITMSNASSRVDLRNVSVEGIDFRNASLHG